MGWMGVQTEPSQKAGCTACAESSGQTGGLSSAPGGHAGPASVNGAPSEASLVNPLAGPALQLAQRAASSNVNENRAETARIRILANV
jgi:hypothetical protein